MTQRLSISGLPIGYTDGIDRHPSNGIGKVWINGSLCPIAGNVCMADITGIAAEEGDATLFFGKELPVEEIAEALQTVIYEILTSVSPRVKRVYFIE